jgi:hypothetical protein
MVQYTAYAVKLNLYHTLSFYLALVGCFIAISIEEVSFYKYSFLQKGKLSMSHDFSYLFHCFNELCSCEREHGSR